nr:MAG TPA: hypothetical protein [Caudoviricetes sp.]DAT18722.1 MAG TPA: hypothetical protein [Caudoviricetes sp.]
MKPLLYTQHTLMIENPSKSLLMLTNQLRDKKISHLEREDFFIFPNK